MAKRDWLAINRISDYRFRIAIALCTDPELLKGYMQGFPQLFLKGDDDGPLRVPLSALRESAATSEGASEGGVEFSSHFCLTWGWHRHPQVRIPIFPKNFGDEDDAGDIAQQLVGQKLQAGLVVKMMSDDYLVIALGGSREEEMVRSIGEVITEEMASSFHLFRLVRAEFVDLNT